MLSGRTEFGDVRGRPMIVRRRQNGRFTIVPNAIFDDQRLPIEGMAVLGYLLSRPDNWRVNLEWVAKKLRVGRQRMQRIFRELVVAGYVTLEKTNGEGGRWHYEYIVRNEPITRPRDTQPSDEIQPVADLPQDEYPPVENHPAEQERKRTINKTTLPKAPERLARPSSLAIKKPLRRDLSGDRGSIERRIAERIGPTVAAGFDIVFSLPSSEVDQLCAMQRRGTLDERTVAKLRLTASG
jgi:hypothetical protein